MKISSKGLVAWMVVVTGMSLLASVWLFSPAFAAATETAGAAVDPGVMQWGFMAAAETSCCRVRSRMLVTA